jgi:hypothetical protein
LNKQKNLALRIVIALIVVFGGGWILGGILNMAAILSPILVGKMQCPPGSGVRENMSPQSFDQPGQKTLTFECVDQARNPVPALADAQTKALEYRYFFPAGVALMALAVIAWKLRSVLRGGARGRTEATPTL